MARRAHIVARVMGYRNSCSWNFLSRLERRFARLGPPVLARRSVTRTVFKYFSRHSTRRTIDNFPALLGGCVHSLARIPVRASLAEAECNGKQEG